MSLTQILLIILTVAAVVAVVFLVRLFIQLRRTAAEAEKTLVEARALAKSLHELDLSVKARVEDVGETLKASRKAAVAISEVSTLVAAKIMPAPAKYLPYILPVARFVFQQMKKRKEKEKSNEQ